MPSYDGDFGALGGLADPEDPFVRELVGKAARSLPLRSAYEYESFKAALAGGPRGVETAAESVYEAVLACPIHYHRAERARADSQPILEYPEMAKEGANCLEMALLFASCACAAGLDPILILIEGDATTDHVLLGLWLGAAERTRPAGEGDGLLGADALAALREPARVYAGGVEKAQAPDAEWLVLDCSGAAIGYRAPGVAVRFEQALGAGRRLVTDRSRVLRCAADVPASRVHGPTLAGRPPQLIGRQDDYEELERAFPDCHVVLSGAIGVGKTALARSYGFRSGSYPGGVFFLNATDEENVVEQIAGFGRACGLRPTVAPTDLAFATLWVENRCTRDVLLIVDNVPSGKEKFVTEQIGGFLTLASLKCRLLITTTDEKLLSGVEGFTQIALAPLENGPAEALLREALPEGEHDDVAVRRVCEQLRNVPLWLIIAGRSLRAERAPGLAEFVRQLSDSGFELPRDDATAPDYRGPNAVLAGAWEGLSAGPGGAREVLKLLSLLPPNETLPVDLLALMLPGTLPEQARATAVSAAVGELCRAGLGEQGLEQDGLEQEDTGEKPRDDTVRIHPYVHRYYAKKTANEDPGFADRALQAASERLHRTEFYAGRSDEDLIGVGAKLRWLQRRGHKHDGIGEVLRVFERQLDHLRQGGDALAQLALQAGLDGATELAAALRGVRAARRGPWFRLRWARAHSLEEDKDPGCHRDAVTALALVSSAAGGPADYQAISAAENGELILWAFDPLRQSRRLIGSGPAVSGLCVHPDGRYAYLAGRDGSLRQVALDGSEPPEIRVLDRRSRGLNGCAVDPLGEFLVAVGDDGCARVYDLPAGTLRGELWHDDRSPLLCCAVARRPRDDKPVLITGSRQGYVKTWDPLALEVRGKKLMPSAGGERLPVTACALSPAGDEAAVATRRGVTIWSLDSYQAQPIGDAPAHVNACCFSPDGHSLIMVGRSKQVLVHRRDSPALERPLTSWFHWLTACVCGPNGRVLYASDDGSVLCGTLEGRGQGPRSPKDVPGRHSWVTVYLAGPGGVLSVSTNRTIVERRTGDGEEVRSISGHANYINAFAVSPNGRSVLSGSDKAAVIYWRLAAPDDSVVLEGLSLSPTACAISDDGGLAVVGAEDGSAGVWRLGDRCELSRHLTAGHEGPVTACAIAPGGELVATGGADAQVLVRNAKSGQIELRFDAHQDRITAIVFVREEPDTVLTASWDGTVKWWNVRSGEILAEFTQHGDCVTSCACAPGRKGFSVALDGKLLRLAMAGGKSDMAIHLGHRLRGLAVESDGRTVICSDMAGTVYCFDVVEGAEDTT